MTPDSRMNTTEPMDRTVSAEAGNTSRNGTHDEVMISLNLSEKTVCLLTVLTCLLGLVGNGTVIWLLGFRIKRSPFSVYILSLACSDFIFLLANNIWPIYYLPTWYRVVLKRRIYSVYFSSLLVSLSLLMAVSTERCVSVLCPIWYRCHRPEHFSSVLCALIWGVGSWLGIWDVLCDLSFDIMCGSMLSVVNVVVFLTFLVFCVSSLTLLIRVQCRSRRRRHSRLYLTIMFSVLAFLLLGLPFNVWILLYWFSSSRHYLYMLLLINRLLLALNSMVNPIIYFFVGRHRKRGRQKSLQEVLQRALMDEEEATELVEGSLSLSLCTSRTIYPPEPEGESSAGTRTLPR